MNAYQVQVRDRLKLFHEYERRVHPLQMWRKLYHLLRSYRHLSLQLFMNLSEEERYNYRFHPGVRPQEIAIIANDIIYSYPASTQGAREAIKDIELYLYEQGIERYLPGKE